MSPLWFWIRIKSIESNISVWEKRSLLFFVATINYLKENKNGVMWNVIVRCMFNNPMHFRWIEISVHVLLKGCSWTFNEYMCMRRDKSYSLLGYVCLLKKWLNLWLYLAVIVWGGERFVKSIHHSQFVEINVYITTMYVYNIQVLFFPHSSSCKYIHIYQYILRSVPILGNENSYISISLNVCMSMNYSFCLNVY